jgi:hypothetical protein
MNSGMADDDILPDLLAAVEQQLVSPQTKYVATTFERLCKAGLDAQQAKEQIALCLGEQMDEMTRRKRGFDEKAYREALDELPLEVEEQGAEGGESSGA